MHASFQVSQFLNNNEVKVYYFNLCDTPRHAGDEVLLDHLSNLLGRLVSQTDHWPFDSLVIRVFAVHDSLFLRLLLFFVDNSPFSKLCYHIKLMILHIISIFSLHIYFLVLYCYCYLLSKFM